MYDNTDVKLYANIRTSQKKLKRMILKFLFYAKSWNIVKYVWFIWIGWKKPKPRIMTKTYSFLEDNF